MPRVDNIDKNIAKKAPSNVDAAAILIVSINAGKYRTICPGSSVTFSDASLSTDAGKSKIRGRPSMNPPALRSSAVKKPLTSRATNTISSIRL